MIDVVKHNSAAWDQEVDNFGRWTQAVDSETVKRARAGDWSIRLTPVKSVPDEWFGDLAGKDLLCLASGGGQQAPILAAAGANVTSFDNSNQQLNQDSFVAERDGLSIRIEQGDAADLSRFPDDSFDLIFNPCSNVFMPDLKPIWNECYRILRRGGSLLTGFVKPELFIFDQYERERGNLVVRHSLPYSDEGSLDANELGEKINALEPLEFGHTLEDQIGLQTAAGFHIVGLYEDYWYADTDEDALDAFMPSFVATRSVKP